MPVPSALVTRFFQLIASRQFTEAERELERVKQKMQKTEWNRGYFRALYGILLVRKANGDSYALLSRLDFDDKPALHGYRREFLNHVRNRLHGDFDRGFFSAWADCMRVFSRIQVPHNVTVPNATNGTAEEHTLETVKTDKSQATMANFIKDAD
ncbi:hypothetical protein MUP79_04470 [Candidatus Bathyarchaeota archaeon]|jgi:hypothetical protein|nr:hypothetical protein [Candidatus Bathyarchaeota archaeon]